MSAACWVVSSACDGMTDTSGGGLSQDEGQQVHSFTGEDSRVLVTDFGMNVDGLLVGVPEKVHPAWPVRSGVTA